MKLLLLCLAVFLWPIITFAFPNGSPICFVDGDEIASGMGGFSNPSLGFNMSIFADETSQDSFNIVIYSEGIEYNSFVGILVNVTTGTINLPNATIAPLDEFQSPPLIPIPNTAGAFNKVKPLMKRPSCDAGSLQTITQSSRVKKALPLVIPFKAGKEEDGKETFTIVSAVVFATGYNWQVLDNMVIGISNNTITQVYYEPGKTGPTPP